MKPRQLEAFRAVMESQTVTRAAEMLHITQPATTRLIADLEASVGFPLFLRARGRLHPTPEALALNEEVTRSLVGLDRIARAADEIRLQQRGSLQVVAAPAMAASMLPRAIADFVKGRPEVQISLLMHSSRTVVDMITGHRCDVGFPILTLDFASPQGRLLASTRMACAIPRGHRLDGRPVVYPTDLAGEPFISHSQALTTRLKIDAVFASHGVERKLQLESQVSATICRFVEAGLGVAIVDAVTASDFPRDGVHFALFEPTLVTDFSVLTPPQQGTSQLRDSFITHVREYLLAHIEPRFVIE